MKVLFLALLLAAVWYGAKFLRWQHRFREEFQRQMDEVARRSQGQAPNPPPAPEAEIDDLAPCPVCGTYGVPGRMTKCQRQDCPYPG